MALPLPPLNLSMATSSDAKASSVFDSSGMVVNFGGGVFTGSGASDLSSLPWWVWAGGLVLVGVYLRRKGGR